MDYNSSYQKVSVVMCTYNGAEYIEEQLDSIIKQTYPIYEIIVQDDLSSDGTIDIIRRYCDRYNNIRFYINETRKGPNRNFWDAFYLAEGEYIAVSDQDDIWEIDKIEHQIKAINRACLCISNSRMFGDFSGLLYEKDPLVSSVGMLLRNSMTGHTCLFRKNILPNNKNIWTSNLISYDAMIGFLALQKGNIVYVNECLTNWRRHISAYSYSNRADAGNSMYKRLKGLFEGFNSLFDKRKRTIYSQYYSELVSVYEDDTIIKYMAYLMSVCTIHSVLICSFYCLRYYNELNPYGTNRCLKLIRAFMTPLFLIRDIENSCVHAIK